MKKVFLIAIVSISFASCQKNKFETKIQGTWKMTEINIDQQGWSNVPETEKLVTISKDSITAPWASNYSVIDDSHVLINQQAIKVDLTKKEMTFSQDGDSLKFKRMN